MISQNMSLNSTPQILICNNSAQIQNNQVNDESLLIIPDNNKLDLAYQGHNSSSGFNKGDISSNTEKHQSKSLYFFDNINNTNNKFINENEITHLISKNERTSVNNTAAFGQTTSIMGLYSNYLLSSVSTHFDYCKEGCIENYFPIAKEITSKKDSPMSQFLISEKVSSNKLISSEELINSTDDTNNTNTSENSLSPISIFSDIKENKDKKIYNKIIFINKGVKRSISNDNTNKNSKKTESNSSINSKRISSLVKIGLMSIEYYYKTKNSDSEINISSSNIVKNKNMLYRNSYSSKDNNDTQLSICKNNDININSNIYDNYLYNTNNNKNDNNKNNDKYNNNNNKINNSTCSTSAFNSSNTNIFNNSLNNNYNKNKNSNIYSKNDNNNIYKCHTLPCFSSNLSERMNILINNRMNICNYSSTIKDTIQDDLNDNLDNYKQINIGNTSNNSNHNKNSCPFKRNSIDSCETNHTNLSSITKTTTNYNNSIPEVQSDYSHSNILDSSQDFSHTYINESSLIYGINKTHNNRSYDTNLNQHTTANLNINNINNNIYNFIEVNNINYYNAPYLMQNKQRIKLPETKVKEGSNLLHSIHIIYQQQPLLTQNQQSSLTGYNTNNAIFGLNRNYNNKNYNNCNNSNICNSNNSIRPSTQTNFNFNQPTPTNINATKPNSRESLRKTTADQGYSNKFNLI